MRFTSQRRRAGATRATAYRGSVIPSRESGKVRVDEFHLECGTCGGGVRVRVNVLLRGHSIGGGTNRAPHIPRLGTGMSPVAAPETAVA